MSGYYNLLIDTYNKWTAGPSIPQQFGSPQLFLSFLRQAKKISKEVLEAQTYDFLQEATWILSSEIKGSADLHILEQCLTELARKVDKNIANGEQIKNHPGFKKELYDILERQVLGTLQDPHAHALLDYYLKLINKEWYGELKDLLDKMDAQISSDPKSFSQTKQVMAAYRINLLDDDWAMVHPIGKKEKEYYQKEEIFNPR